MGDDEELSKQERTNLQTFMLLITQKAKTSAELSIDYNPITPEDYDKACLSVLALADGQCPDARLERICQIALNAKEKYIKQYGGSYGKIWKQLSNKLVYSFIKVFT